MMMTKLMNYLEKLCCTYVVAILYTWIAKRSTMLSSYKIIRTSFIIKIAKK